MAWHNILSHVVKIARKQPVFFRLPIDSLNEMQLVSCLCLIRVAKKKQNRSKQVYVMLLFSIDSKKENVRNVLITVTFTKNRKKSVLTFLEYGY